MSPIIFTWDGEVMKPQPRFAKMADRQYVVGEDYPLAPVSSRSQASHNQYFALIHEAWLNLPEAFSERFPSEDHLRKYALIKAGYRDERTLVCASKAEALRVAAFTKPIDEYALVTVRDAVVTVYTAKSQSAASMGKEDFQASKDAVLGVLAAMLGVEPGQLAKAQAA